jgi:hypothetical protein
VQSLLRFLTARINFGVTALRGEDAHEDKLQRKEERDGEEDDRRALE